jgi:hypothetical protein
MSLFANTTALKIVDSVAIVLSHALQLARARISSSASPVLRMMTQRDHAVGQAAVPPRNSIRGKSMPAL